MYGLDFNLVSGLILTFIRTATAFVLMPVFGYQAVPPQVKAGLALLVAVVMAPAASQHIAVGSPGIMPIVAAAISEVMVGLIFGLVALLIMMGAQFAGSVIGIQIGLGIAQVVDPQYGSQISLLGRMNYSLALIIFILLDFHLRFLDALYYTFTVIPLGGALFPADMAMNYARLTADIFVIGVKLAAPVMAMLFLIQVSLGFIARVFVRMNVFLVGLPLKIGVGLLGMAITMPLFVYVISKSFHYFLDGLLVLIRMVAGI